MNSTWKELWPLDPKVDFLNHGSFGSCPRAILELAQQFRARLERQPVQFLVRDLEPLLDESRAALAQFVGATPDNLVFVPNATAGVNTVVRSLAFETGDELLVTNHEYNACRNALAYAASRHQAKVVVAAMPFPLTSPAQLIEAILSQTTARTKLALIDHITSQTGLVMPIARIVRELAARGIDTLVDGAHGPGMVPLELEKLGAAYYAGNCHKWLCAPKTAGFLHVRPDRQNSLHPLSTSHGFNSPRTDRSRFQLEFGWTGTWDPAPTLCLPELIRYMGVLIPGGWPEIMARNRQLALAGREILCQALNIPAPCPEECIGSMASLPLPDGPPGEKLSLQFLDPLQDRLLQKHQIEIPIIPWPQYPRRLIRLCAQLYNDPDQYRHLARALLESLKT